MPAVICTGFGERFDEKKGKELGVGGVLMKPVTKKDLAIVILKVPDAQYLPRKLSNRQQEWNGLVAVKEKILTVESD